MLVYENNWRFVLKSRLLRVWKRETESYIELAEKGNFRFLCAYNTNLTRGTTFHFKRQYRFSNLILPQINRPKKEEVKKLGDCGKMTKHPINPSDSRSDRKWTLVRLRYFPLPAWNNTRQVRIIVCRLNICRSHRPECHRENEKLLFGFKDPRLFTDY